MARDVLVRLVGIFRRMRVAEPTTRLSGRSAQLAPIPIHEPLVRPSDQSSYEAVAHVSLGCLFGPGFDTATEVALLVTAGRGAAGHLPFVAIMCVHVRAADATAARRLHQTSCLASTRNRSQVGASAPRPTARSMTERKLRR